MCKILTRVLAISLGLAAWSDVAVAELLSKTGPVIAIMANELFLGEAEGHLSGAGTIAIHSQRNPDVTCSGQFTSSAKLGGLGKMRCSNGVVGNYQFKRLTLEKGYGVGSYGRRSMSFTYGLTLNESQPYLKLPPGKKLEDNGKTLVLADISPAAPRKPTNTTNPKTSPSY